MESDERMTWPGMAAMACAVVGMASAWPSFVSAADAEDAVGAGKATAPIASAAPQAELRFDVTGFDLRGPDPLPPGAARAVLAPFVGPGATLARLREAVAALERALRAHGFGLYRVRLLPQALEGRVALEIRPLRLGTIEVQGLRHSTEAQVRRSLPSLVPGATPDLHEVAAETALANDNPMRQAQLVLRERDVPGGDDSVNVQVRVRERRPWLVTASLSNHGSPATGQDRFTISGRHADLNGRDMDLQLAFTTSLEQPRSVRQFGAALRVPLYGVGWQLSGQFTRSDVVGDFGGFTSSGAGHVAGLDYSTYLPTGGRARHLVGLFFQDRLYESTRIDGLVLPGQVDRRSRPIGLRYAGRLEADAGLAEPGIGLGGLGGDWQWAADWQTNTGWGPGNDLAAYQSEDPRIRTVRWQALRFSLGHTRTLDGWGLALRTQGQLASTAMINGDQLGLGGVASVRGTREERPLSGDSGWLGSVELTTPAREGWRLAGFIDAGVIRNEPAPEGRPVHDRLASAGLGLRWNRPDFAMVLDWGRIIEGSRTSPAVLPSAPRRGDERLYLAITLAF